MMDQPVVVITGASRGIGRAISEDLAHHGFVVWLVSRNRDSLEEVERDIRSQGGHAEIAVCDLRQAAEVHTLVEHIKRTSGHVHGLVNNAGTNRRGSLKDVTPEDYEDIMATNVRGPLFLTQALARLMPSGSSVVNVASLNAIQVLKSVGLYAASKAALVQLTRAFAIDFADLGIRVNAVAPGFIRTEFNAGLWDRPEMTAWVESNTPLQRLGQPRDVVGVVRFLLGSDSGFVTGAVLSVDGGFLSSRLWPL